jgi:signal transduction histidine kinase
MEAGDMMKQIAAPQSDRERKTGVIRVFSLGFLYISALAVIETIIVWLFNRDYPVVTMSLVCAVGIVTSLIAYWMGRLGKLMFASYFFVSMGLIECSLIVVILGGYAGPMAIVYLIPILMAGMLINIGSSFIVAAIATALYLAMIPVENTGYFPRIITLTPQENTIQVMTAGINIIFFFVAAFLSWFASSRLSKALHDVSRFASELQTSNEKLQASEEELRASNEELEASNEELRTTEEELRASNEELQTTNEELKSAQERLIRTEKLAAIGQLAGGVGHELRNPLGAIKNAVYYIKGKVVKSELAQKEPRVVEFLGIVDDEINASNKIINDLLSFSRVGKPAASPARIETVINDAISHITIPENVRLTKNVLIGLPEIIIDTDQIRQVLVNIFTNAIQAMPEGGELGVTARENTNYMEVEISDTGTGIPKEIIGKVFDPLYTTKAKGIGLGLAVCKSIIDRHEGQINVASSVGKGTTFTIKLPLKAK